MKLEITAEKLGQALTYAYQAIPGKTTMHILHEEIASSAVSRA